jgi:hypothetical protein
MVVISWTQIRSVNEYDPRKQKAGEAIYNVGPGGLVWVLTKHDVALPSDAEIPGNRCIVSYRHKGRTIAGTIDVRVLTLAPRNYTDPHP